MVGDDDRMARGVAQAGGEAESGELVLQELGGEPAILPVCGLGADRWYPQQGEQAFAGLVEPRIYLAQYGFEGVRRGGWHVGALGCLGCCAGVWRGWRVRLKGRVCVTRTRVHLDQPVIGGRSAGSSGFGGQNPSSSAPR